MGNIDIEGNIGTGVIISDAKNFSLIGKSKII